MKKREITIGAYYQDQLLFSSITWLTLKNGLWRPSFYVVWIFSLGFDIGQDSDAKNRFHSGQFEWKDWLQHVRIIKMVK